MNYSRKKDLRFRSGEAILKHSYQKKREDPGKLNVHWFFSVFQHIILEFNDWISFQKPESEMNVLDYAEATPSGFDCPMQTTPTDASRVNRHLERSVRLHPLPVISPISIPPYESPEFKYYRHMLYWFHKMDDSEVHTALPLRILSTLLTNRPLTNRVDS